MGEMEGTRNWAALEIADSTSSSGDFKEVRFHPFGLARLVESHEGGVYCEKPPEIRAVAFLVCAFESVADKLYLIEPPVHVIWCHRSGKRG